MSFPPLVDGASEQLRRKILQSLTPKGMGDKFAGGVAERLDEELNSLIQDYETIKEFADFLANSTAEERQALLNKYGDAAKKLFTDSEYRGQVGEAIVEAFKEGITDDIEKFTRIKSGDEKDIGYTTTHAALMAYGIWKRYGKKIGKEVVRAVDDDVAKSTVDSKTLKKAKDGGVQTAKGGAINPNKINFSQTSAGGRGRYQAIKESMQQNGWIGDPIDVIQTNKGFTSIDNTRLVVARDLGLDNIPVRIHKFTDPLPENMIGRFGNSKTWIDALKYRTGRQNPALPYYGTDTIPYVKGR
ncbi:MAG: hypothetical protein O9346_13655 [Leptospiraceae bacterium]|nr:hypothetical protein [Leptospiraceae bacterium]